MASDAVADRISTGIGGLDEILHGGLIPERGYLVSGAPGTGKSVLGLHFLSQCLEEGGSALYVNLEESEADVRANAATLGFDLDGMEFLDLSPGTETFLTDSTYDVFAPEEVEGEDLKAGLRSGIEAVGPDRVFIDPVTHLRDFTADEYQFRKQVTALVEYLKESDATVLFSSQDTGGTENADLQFLSDGWIRLDYDGTIRTVSVPKFRGSDMASGRHGLEVTGAGMAVYPKLSPGGERRPVSFEALSSGVAEIDDLLHGGIERGTVTVVSGPTGVGKTTLGTQFLWAAAARDERSVVYTFEEATETLVGRSESVGIPVEEMRDGDTLAVEEVPPFEYTPTKFAAAVRREVEDHGTEMVLIDGIDGYRNSLQFGADESARRELHALGRYLKDRGCTVVLVDTLDSVTGEFRATESGLSYLADNIVFLRYLETDGRLRKAIGVLKKRMSDYERTLREFAITDDGIDVGEPLTGLRGILHGTPDVVGDRHDTERREP